MKKVAVASGYIFIISLLMTTLACKTKNNQESKSESKIYKDSNTVHEEQISKKKSTLMKLKGEHKLRSISGYLGANTIVDYFIEKGKWIAFKSTFQNRQCCYIQLSKRDLDKLKSMKIVIAEDLSLAVYCNDKQYFYTPYNENGFSYFLNRSPKEYIKHMPENLTANSTFINEHLFFYVNNDVKEADIKAIDFLDFSPNSVLIVFNSNTNEFEMKLFDGDFDDNISTYIFK